LEAAIQKHYSNLTIQEKAKDVELLVSEDALLYFNQKFEELLQPVGPTTRTLQVFFPKKLAIQKFRAVLGQAKKDLPYSFWDSRQYLYREEVVSEWDDLTVGKCREIFGDCFKPKAYGGKDKEICFDPSRREVCGGVLIPNSHSLNLKYDWGKQNLTLEFSYYKYEVFVDEHNELYFDKL